ncbi:hypothetical protein TKK_0005737 [Trichogramma kaykai]
MAKQILVLLALVAIAAASPAFQPNNVRVVRAANPQYGYYNNYGGLEHSLDHQYHEIEHELQHTWNPFQRQHLQHDLAHLNSDLHNLHYHGYY